MIDRNGYRLNVGIIIANKEGKLFWGKRTKSQGWQFPQGGMNPYETLEETLDIKPHGANLEIGIPKELVKGFADRLLNTLDLEEMTLINSNREVLRLK